MADKETSTKPTDKWHIVIRTAGSSVEAGYSDDRAAPTWSEIAAMFATIEREKAEVRGATSGGSEAVNWKTRLRSTVRRFLDDHNPLRGRRQLRKALRLLWWFLVFCIAVTVTAELAGYRGRSSSPQVHRIVVTTTQTTTTIDGTPIVIERKK